MRQISVALSLDKFSNLISETLDNQTFQRLVYSKPVAGNEFLRSEIIPFNDKSGRVFKLSQKTKTQDFTKVIHPKDISVRSKELTTQYLAVNLFTSSQQSTLLCSKKGVYSLITKKTRAPHSPLDPTSTEILEHNRQKAYKVPGNAPYLHPLGITSNNGQVIASMQKKYRQINRFIELISHIIGEDKIQSVADMGCGKGYLTFSLYEFLQKRSQEVQLTGYEIRADLVNQCNDLAKRLNYSGLRFEQSDIAEANTGNLDVLIALHACDIATDMAIKKGLDAQAAYIILSPCCHKQIRKAMTVKDIYTENGIYEERLAEMITDLIRSRILQHYGYKTSIIEFISPEHTGKNTMIIAKKTGQINSSALSEIAELKDKYGIGMHYLEKLCGLSLS